jgi:hypothetical protein
MLTIPSPPDPSLSTRRVSFNIQGLLTFKIAYNLCYMKVSALFYKNDFWAKAAVLESDCSSTIF